MRRLLFVTIALLLLFLAERSAKADEALARQHFKKGIDLYDRKQYAEALQAFQDAYREKPSAGIKQNIALSLKGMGKPAEAATAFDEALDENGKNGTLKPETKAAIEHELAELTKVVATVSFSAIAAGEDKKAVDNVVITVTDAASDKAPPRSLPPGAHKHPLRLMPGLYIFTARAQGYKDPEPKKLALVSGDPVTASFVFTPGVGGASATMGVLTITPNVADAVVKLDGQTVGTGRWSGSVAAGSHHIEVVARGMKTTTAEVTVTAGATVDYPVTLTAYGEAPPEYVANLSKPKKRPRFYLVPAVMLNTTSYRLSGALGEPNDPRGPYGTRRDFGGGTLGVRAGAFLGKGYISAELDAEVGRMEAKYKLAGVDRDTTTTIVNWQLTPVLRLVAPPHDKVRFTSGVGIGLHGLSVDASIAKSGQTESIKGAGLGYSLLADAGLQIDLGPVFLEGALFVNVHSMQGVRSDPNKDDASKGDRRLLLASPATRGGIRAGIGFVF